MLTLGDEMKKINWKTYGIWIGLTEAIGVLSGWLSRKGSKWFGAYAKKPPLSPPMWAFPVVWSILYALMGISAARIYQAPASSARSRGLNLFIIQLTLNFFWSLIFFNARAYGFALVWLVILWIVVVLMILAFRKVDPLAGWLQVPYLIWLSFAAYLNYGVWLRN